MGLRLRKVLLEKVARTSDCFLTLHSIFLFKIVTELKLFMNRSEYLRDLTMRPCRVTQFKGRKGKTFWLSDESMAKEVAIVSDGENSSDEESEDEETAGKVVTKAGVEVN